MATQIRIDKPRTDVAREALKLPFCMMPKPGEQVTWYKLAVKYEGMLVGHKYDGRPCIQTGSGVESVASFAVIRRADHTSIADPNWAKLPEEARFVLPTPAEAEAFDRLLNKVAPPGTRIRDLMWEIFERGFEVFLCGRTVLDVMTQRPPGTAEIVTTMPLHVLQPLAQSMYSEKYVHIGDSDRQDGYMAIGQAANPAGRVAQLRLFRHTSPGTAEAEFGADICLDTQHGDLSCNAVYYDPFNAVLLDPTGFGISDVDDKLLRLVCADYCQDPRDSARIALRLVKLRQWEYQPAPGEEGRLKDLDQKLPALTDIELLALVDTEVCSGLTADEAKAAMDELQAIFDELGEGRRFENCLRLKASGTL